MLLTSFVNHKVVWLLLCGFKLEPTLLNSLLAVVFVLSCTSSSALPQTSYSTLVHMQLRLLLVVVVVL